MKIAPESSEAIQEAVRVLAAGGTVIHATETCYGLACDLTNPQALDRLFAVKHRPDTQPVSALFSSLEEAKKYVVFSEKALSLAQMHLPGPLTLVLPRAQHSPLPLYVCPLSLSPITSNLSPTIGVRISSHPFAQCLALAFGKPLVTTSANLHSAPNPYTLSELQSQYAGSAPLPDLVIDSGSLPEQPPSTIVEVVGDDVRVLRQGDIHF